MTIYNMTLSTTEPYNNVGAVTVRQDDNLTQTFVATIVENGTRKKDLSGYQVFFNALFDGNIIARDLAQYDYSKNIATYTLRDSFFQQTGEVEAYFSFEKDGKRDSTANFSYYVTQGNYRNIRQGNYIYELEELMSVSDDIIKNKDFTVLLEENRKLNAKLEEVKSGFSNQVDELRKDFSRELAQTNKNVSEHEDNKENPHNVTPNQLGVYTKEETDKSIKKEYDKQVIHSKRIVNYADSGKYFDEKTEFNYNLASNQKLVSVKLIFSGFDPAEQALTQAGYMSYSFDNEDFRNGQHYLPFILSTGTTAIKSVGIKNTGVSGHAYNRTDENSRKIVLRRVVVYYTEN